MQPEGKGYRLLEDTTNGDDTFTDDSQSIKSVLSCDELAWPNAVDFGSVNVCGESSINLGGCSGLLNSTQANHFCTAAGARLCTLTELENDETRKTGCGLDSRLVWSSSPCTGGYYVAYGSSAFPSPLTCSLTSNEQYARCCADVFDISSQEPTPFPSPDLSSVSPTIPLSSITFSPAPLPTYQSTPKPVLKPTPSPTPRPISSTTPSPSVQTIPVSTPTNNQNPLPSASPALLPISIPSYSTTSVPTQNSIVSDFYAMNISTLSCTELEWEPPRSKNTAQVCSGYPDNCTSKYVTQLTWTKARDACEDMGARLCSFVELQEGYAESKRDLSKCNVDNELVWSRTQCDSGMFYTSQVNRFPTSSCSSPVESFGVVCCADGVEL